jgi:hypothetical protein
VAGFPQGEGCEEMTEDGITRWVGGGEDLTVDGPLNPGETQRPPDVRLIKAFGQWKYAPRNPHNS